MWYFLVLSTMLLAYIDAGKLPLVIHPYHEYENEFGTRLFHPNKYGASTHTEKPKTPIKLLPVQVVKGQSPLATSATIGNNLQASTVTRVKPIQVADSDFEGMVQSLKSSGQLPPNAEVVKVDASGGNWSSAFKDIWRKGKLLPLDKVQSVITSLSRPFMEIDLNPLAINIRSMLEKLPLKNAPKQGDQATPSSITTSGSTQITQEAATASSQNPVTRIIVVEVPHDLNLVENASNFEWITKPPANLEGLSTIFNMLGRTVKSNDDELEITTTTEGQEVEEHAEQGRLGLEEFTTPQNDGFHVEDEESVTTAYADDDFLPPTVDYVTEPDPVIVTTKPTSGAIASTPGTIKISPVILPTTPRPASLVDLLLNKAVTAPSAILSALPGVSFFPNSSRTNYNQNNFVSTRNHSVYLPNCHCDKLWRCQKLQISLVPRCQPGYFYCCYSQRRSMPLQLVRATSEEVTATTPAPFVASSQMPLEEIDSPKLLVRVNNPSPMLNSNTKVEDASSPNPQVQVTNPHLVRVKVKEVDLSQHQVEVDDPSGGYEYEYDYEEFNESSNEASTPRQRREVYHRNADPIQEFLRSKGIKRQRHGVDPDTILRDEEEVKATGSHSQMLQMLSRNNDSDVKEEEADEPKISDFAMFLMKKKKLNILVPKGKKVEDYVDKN